MSQPVINQNYIPCADVLSEDKLWELLSIWEVRLEGSKTQDYCDHCKKQIRLYKLRLARLGLTP